MFSAAIMVAVDLSLICVTLLLQFFASSNRKWCPLNLFNCTLCQVQRLKGRSSELQEALAAEITARRSDQQEFLMRQQCKDCAEERLQRSEVMADCQRLQTELMEFEAVKLQMRRFRSNQDRLRDQLVDEMKALIAHHERDDAGTADVSPRNVHRARDLREQPSVFAADVLPDDFNILRGEKDHWTWLVPRYLAQGL